MVTENQRERSRVLIRANDLVILHNKYLRTENFEEAAFMQEKLEQHLLMALDRRVIHKVDQEQIMARLLTEVPHEEIETGRGDSGLAIDGS